MLSLSRLLISHVPQGGYATGALPSHNMLESFTKRTEQPIRLTSLHNATFICVDEKTMLNVQHVAMIKYEDNEIRFIPDSTLGYTAKTCEVIRKYANCREAREDYEYLSGQT